jgi:D-alanine-D-alanine ligase-like ATP-grasp enzyme
MLIVTFRGSLSAAAIASETAAAIAIYQLLQMRDYGKVDARLTPEGQVVFIEGNPNPDLAPQLAMNVRFAALLLDPTCRTPPR